MVNVMILENDAMTRTLLSLYIAKRPAYRVALETDEAHLSRLPSCRVDLVLLDAASLSLMTRLRARMIRAKIIVMTKLPESSYLNLAKNCGADSFWYQSPDEAALWDVVDRTMSGESIYPDALCVRFGKADTGQITGREIEVLREIAQGATDAEIAMKLGVTLRTVKGHIQNMREKTGFRNRTELAVRARGCGLIVTD